MSPQQTAISPQQEVKISTQVNGRAVETSVPAHLLLADFIRDTLGLTGTKIGCDTGECGACTVLVDGKPVPSCLVLALRCDGQSIETIEGLAAQNRPHRRKPNTLNRSSGSC